MSGPPDERSRPGGRTEAAKATQAADLKSNSTLPRVPDNSRDVLLDELLRLDPAQMHAAALGYLKCILDRQEARERREGEAGADVASSPEWRKIKRQPRWAEVQRRRGECPRRHRIENCTCGGAR